MEQNTFQFTYEVYDSSAELNSKDQLLLEQARETTQTAYAPYSNFHVGAVARLVNGQMVRGSNQENASFPVGICAERVLLSAISSLYPGEPVETIAISYNHIDNTSDHPISPCGVCRQSLNEYQVRSNHPIRLVLAGLEGKVYVISNANMLLPLAFSNEELG